ncbi:hypothetical protein [Nocardia sp. NRRL S-836]|uniref:hypothetical protein n=1 Tax=Nocardia sp. NRRL S-836 TaxID=1519492 RepID=UPI0006ADC403|nr:hypothetical protein [Nocardia sp. NRRL S-836]KOV84725.1 hypothetical protein ADL03_15775 [Nocardia sp. NRRL S-836]
MLIISAPLAQCSPCCSGTTAGLFDELHPSYHAVLIALALVAFIWVRLLATVPAVLLLGV